MWVVLIQSNSSSNLTTLSSIKRFIFVIEGLTIDQDDIRQTKIQPKVLKNLKQLFSEFKPLYLNRLANRNQGQAILSPRTCGTDDENLTFRPILSPKNEQILERRRQNSVHADPELRKK